MSKLPTTYKLSSGHEIPFVGLGTLSQPDKDSLLNAILKANYVHLDTAQLYGNEELIGEVLAEAFAKGKKREDLFITTKIWMSDYGNPEGAIKTSLKKLGLTYVDLYLIHLPHMLFAEPKKPLHILWGEMEGLVGKGLTRSIGVSNFNTQLLWDLLTYAKIPPAVNQIELHPVNAQADHLEFLKAKNILPMAYCPIARSGGFEKGDPFCNENWPDLRKDEYLQSLSKKYNKTVVQVMLNWHVCRGTAVIPKAAGLDHQKENIDIYDFRLTDEEVEQIVKKCDKGMRMLTKLPFHGNFNLFS